MKGINFASIKLWQYWQSPKSVSMLLTSQSVASFKEAGQRIWSICKGFTVGQYLLARSSKFVLWTSRVSREYWLWDVAIKRIEFLFVFYCFKNHSIAHNFGTKWSDSGGVFSKMYLSKWALQSNRKPKMSHVLLQTDFPRSHHICVWNIQAHV